MVSVLATASAYLATSNPVWFPLHPQPMKEMFNLTKDGGGLALHTVFCIKI